MYIAELDRPWLDTPFLLQGFMLEEAEQLLQLRKYCEHVFIDPYRSIGSARIDRPHFKAERVLRTEADPLLHMERVVEPTHKPGSLLGDLRAALRETLTPVAKPAEPPAEPAEPADRPLNYFYDLRKQRDLDKFLGNYVPKAVPKDFPLLGDLPDTIPTPRDTMYYVAPQKTGGTSLLRGIRDLARGGQSRERAPVRTFGEVNRTVYQDSVPVERELPQAESVRDQTSRILAEISENIRKDFVLDVAKVNLAVESMIESMVRNPNAMIWLTQLKNRDSYAYSHAMDSSVYLIAFGRHLGFPREQMHNLGITGLLLDIGKIRVPEQLLQKTGILTEEEFETVRGHVQHSIDILHNADNTPLEVLDAVATHHERLDGAGYPRGLRGRQIGMLGAMAGIVDTFVAMTSQRPYAPAMSAQQALQEIYGWRDTLFPAALIEQFIQCIGIFPAGSIVELNSGEVALIASQNRIRKLKPRLLMVLDADKRPYKQPWILDLIQEPSNDAGKPYYIRRALPPGTHDIDPKQYYLG